MTDRRLSIDEMKAAHECVVAGCWNDSRDRLVAAAPVLLEIAEAALAWSKVRDDTSQDEKVKAVIGLLNAVSKVKP